jgi:hypothetical protein
VSNQRAAPNDDISWLDSILSNKECTNFAAANTQKKREICAEWLRSARDRLDLDQITKGIARVANKDLKIIYDALNIRNNRDLQDFRQAIGNARCEIKVILDAYQQEEEATVTFTGEYSRGRYFALMNCQKYLEEAQEKLEQDPLLLKQTLPLERSDTVINFPPSKDTPKSDKSDTPESRDALSQIQAHTPNLSDLSNVKPDKLREVMLKAYNKKSKFELLCKDLDININKVKGKGLELSIGRLIEEMKLLDRYQELIQKVVKDYPGTRELLL